MACVEASPGFSAPPFFSMALGIGGNTAMFRILNAALLRPLAYPDPEVCPGSRLFQMEAVASTAFPWLSWLPWLP